MPPSSPCLFPPSVHTAPMLSGTACPTITVNIPGVCHSVASKHSSLPLAVSLRQIFFREPHKKSCDGTCKEAAGFLLFVCLACVSSSSISMNFPKLTLPSPWLPLLHVPPCFWLWAAASQCERFSQSSPRLSYPQKLTNHLGSFKLFLFYLLRECILLPPISQLCK